ncbi:hypothetical protein [Polaribacter sp. Hel_I_88]|uniref:hypothetical protein n=1 Tax=Polaribacter sp. Hel_I_88 TaxID=1250006 RepID=UPI00047B39D6|nr:hypothetical protein [Polaribacter sp. Hel_I_88]
MKKITILLSIFLLISCQNFGQLKVLGELPGGLKEISGNEIVAGSDLIWIHEDGGNKSEIFAIDFKGKIKIELDIKEKNNDWEDITSDEFGNLYIGDFGNNYSSRNHLKILKINKKDLDKKEVEVEEIEFEYEHQDKFPPKKKDRFFDAEGFFYFKNNFYVFTKSRVADAYGKTSLYKIPAKKGKHTAKKIGSFNNGKESNAWITAADISEDGKKVVLLSQKNVLIFTDFKSDNFLSGKVKKIPLEHQSQKEGVCFKDKNTLIITDEKAGRKGGFLYELKIN